MAQNEIGALRYMNHSDGPLRAKMMFNKRFLRFQSLISIVQKSFANIFLRRGGKTRKNKITYFLSNFFNSGPAGAFGATGFGRIYCQNISVTSNSRCSNYTALI